MKKTKKNTMSAKVENVNEVVNAAKVAQVEVLEAAEAVDVDTTTVTAFPAVVQAYPDKKVSAKDACHAAIVLKSRIQAERKGANATIRLIGDAAINGDANAINVLCALCDIPTNCLYLLTVDKVRAAVNAWYPYYTEMDNRKINVKARGVWYTDARDNEDIAEAAKRVTRGYAVIPVDDYLGQLIAAAKCRAKGIKPRRVDADAVYANDKLSEAVDGINITDINDAKARKAYTQGAVNVWRKSEIFGYYI